jgi:hypothetical protein
MTARQLASHRHHPSVRIDSQDDLTTYGGRGFTRKESQEAINGTSRSLGKDVPLEIWQDFEVHVDGANEDEREKQRRKERRVLDLEVGESEDAQGYQNKTTVTARI